MAFPEVTDYAAEAVETYAAIEIVPGEEKRLAEAQHGAA